MDIGRQRGLEASCDQVPEGGMGIGRQGERELLAGRKRADICCRHQRADVSGH